MATETELLPEGTVLKDRFKIVKHLSKGRNSNLYIVEDQSKFGLWVLKQLISKFSNPVEAKQAYQQFELQGKILNALNHPQLPKVEDFFEEASSHFMVMEYLEGKNFQDLIKESKEAFAEQDIIGWGIQLCEVLHYLHTQENPIIFRDLKPENIILTKNNSVKLVNFGISKIFDPQSRTLAVAKTINPHFSPIEQYAMVTDARCDIYSLGATLYYIATKELPADAMDRTMNNVPLKFCREFNPSISLELEGIILKAMESEKEGRYQTAEEMMLVLKEIYSPQEKPVEPEQEKIEEPKESEPVREVKQKEEKSPPVADEDILVQEDDGQKGKSGEEKPKGFIDWLLGLLGLKRG